MLEEDKIRLELANKIIESEILGNKEDVILQLETKKHGSYDHITSTEIRLRIKLIEKNDDIFQNIIRITQKGFVITRPYTGEKFADDIYYREYIKPYKRVTPRKPDKLKLVIDKMRKDLTTENIDIYVLGQLRTMSGEIVRS